MSKKEELYKMDDGPMWDRYEKAKKTIKASMNKSSKKTKSKKK